MNADNTDTLDIATNNSPATSAPSWELDGVSYPLFPFDEPCTVKLPNGTVHRFKMWSLAAEKRREDLLKSIVVTSPAQIHGENPLDVKTDFTKSLLAYYELMIDDFGGVKLDGIDQNGTYFKALDLVDGKVNRQGKPARYVDMLSPAIRKAAAARLYSGKIEVEKPDTEDESELSDPFGSDEEFDMAKEIARQEAAQQTYSLSLERTIIVRQSLGIEQIGNTGRMTEPTHVIRYFANDPEAEDFSRWEMKGQKGYAISMKGGGQRAETYYNLDTVSKLFDKLINRIEGASLYGKPIDIPLIDQSDNKQRDALLALVPLQIKKNVVVQIFREANSMGNV